MREVITIYSARIAKQIIETRKFNLVSISADKAIKIKTIFYFENTLELREYLKKNFDIEIEVH
ncbi:hypothetical protein [Tissierella praeacuta]|uniref:hypothetical protein n=1 Tax=Tissierella praeacuta TaxID=43131 RepID=UPI0028AA7F05|nr:hypothetical protein [Tissierella praeacuta]